MASKSPKNLIIPAILASSRREFLEKLENIRQNGKKPKLLQIDVADGHFVPSKTWATPGRIKGLNLDIPFEVHLMIRRPERAYKKWIEAGACRIVFHYEATEDHVSLAKAIKAAGAKPILALNPETRIAVLPLIIRHCYAILLMGVHPGFGGQKQLPATLKKVASLHRTFPTVHIEVDGGVRDSNISKLIEAGATELVAGSAYFTL